MTLDGSRYEWTRVERQCRSTQEQFDDTVQKRAAVRVGTGCSWRRFNLKATLHLFVVLSFLTAGSVRAADTHETDPHPEQPIDIGSLPPGTPRTVAEHNNHAIEFAQKGQLDDAIAELSLALELAPEDTIALYNRANFYFRNRKLDRAIADFTEVIRLKPNFALAFLNRGAAYSSQGRLDDSLSDLNAAEQLRVDNFLIFYNRAVVHALRREFDLAIADFDSTLQLKPKDVLALLGRGLAFETIGKTDLAIIDYRSALEADPASKPAELALQRIRSNL